MHFKIKRSRNKQWFYELIARNGKILFVSETMLRKASCVKSITSIKKGISNAKVLIEE